MRPRRSACWLLDGNNDRATAQRAQAPPGRAGPEALYEGHVTAADEASLSHRKVFGNIFRLWGFRRL